MLPWQQKGGQSEQADGERGRQGEAEAACSRVHSCAPCPATSLMHAHMSAGTSKAQGGSTQASCQTGACSAHCSAGH